MTVHSLLRVSTERDQTVEVQRRQIEAWAASQGVTDAIVFHEEQGVSGRADARPVRDAVLAALADGDALVVAAIDRIGRRANEVCVILTELQRRNVRVVSLREGIDLSTTLGRMFGTMLGYVAELEVEMIASRTKASLAGGVNADGDRISVRGKRLGSPPGTVPPSELAKMRERFEKRHLIAAETGQTIDEVLDEIGRTTAGTRMVKGVETPWSPGRKWVRLACKD